MPTKKTTAKAKVKSKKSSVRHTRAIALDRTKRQDTLPPPAEIEQALHQVIQPATFQLMRYYQDLGLRERVLTLPVMLAFVLSLIWRQLGSVSEAVRVLAREGLLWQPPLRVSQQAVTNRLRQIPATLFAQVLEQVLPVMHQRWQNRTHPMPPQMQLALRHFKRVVAVDGSTLDGVLKRTGLLREEKGLVLGGKMMALLDLASQLPFKIWYGEDSQAHDQQWWPQIIEALEEESLVLFDLGFVNYARYLELSESPTPKYFVTRVKTNMVYEKLTLLEEDKMSGVCSWLVRIGEVAEGTEQLLRLVEVKYEGQTYQYLTNVKDCARLSGLEIGWLYRNRWRTCDAFKTVKRLLGLAFFHGSSLNAIAVQVWGSWLLYCVLIDLTDGVAQQTCQPFRQISVEMVYRGLYHYSQALSRGETRSVYEFLAAEAKLLGIIKRPRKKPLRL